MYGLRREEEITKKVESKAGPTGANMALIDDLFKLCCFILVLVFCSF
jgi:hypothetical protein